MDKPNDAATASVTDAVRRVTDAAGEAVGDAKQAAMQSVEDVRAKAGDKGHSTAQRLRELAGQVAGDMPWMSNGFTKAADGLDSVTDSLTKGDFSQSLSGVTEFARRQPAIFLGASVALGFALSRIGKAALEKTQPTGDATQTPFDGVEGSYATGTEI